MVESYWKEISNSKLGALSGPLKADAVIIGAGITGLMTAYLLQELGASVTVVERDEIGSGESSNTTAHLTCVTDSSLRQLVSDFGEDHAVAVWDCGLSAIELIHEISHKEHIDCDFHWVPGYYFESLEKSGQRSEFEEEAELAARLHFDASFVERIPIFNKPGMKLERQAKFHPTKFLRGLAQAIIRNGGKIFEESEVTEFCDDEISVMVNGIRVEGGQIIIATHVPLQGFKSTPSAALFQTKLYPYTSYVLRARLDGEYAEALFWDSSDPYYYIRIDREEDACFAIFGGVDRKTGQEDSPDENYFGQLESRLAEFFSGSTITHRWAGQVVETNDGLPFIGQDGKQFVATGFSGNGFTFGTTAAQVISDQIMARKNPWAELFAPGRTKIKAGAWDYLKENFDYPYYMAKRLLTSADERNIDELREGEGGIFRVGGKKVAACRAQGGTTHVLSPECTHMGCLVRWNSKLESWDCPCHGSRFAPDGSVLGGPAETPLEPVTREP